MSTELLEKPETEMGVVKLTVTDQEVARMKQNYLSLTINGVDDKAGLKKVYEARQDVKKTRVALQKHAKGLREKAVEWQKKVLKEENRVVSELEAIEEHLQAEEDKIAAEKQRLDLLEQEKENQRVQSRIDSLAEYGYTIDYVLIKGIDDQKFDDVLQMAKIKFEEEKAAKAEADRLAEEARIKAEADAKELEALRAKQAEADRILKDEEERKVKAIADAKEKAERETADALMARVKKFTDLGMVHDPVGNGLIYDTLIINDESIESASAEGFEVMVSNTKEFIELLKKAAEEKRLKDIEDAKAAAATKALADKAAADKKAKEDSDREAALRPDKEKLEAFANSLGKIIDFQVKDAKAQDIIDDIATMIGKMQIHILKKVKEL